MEERKPQPSGRVPGAAARLLQQEEQRRSRAATRLLASGANEWAQNQRLGQKWSKLDVSCQLFFSKSPAGKTN